jgi:hypothetical protein
LDEPDWNAMEGAPSINGTQGQFSVPADQTCRFYRIVVQ